MVLAGKNRLPGFSFLNSLSVQSVHECRVVDDIKCPTGLTKLPSIEVLHVFHSDQSLVADFVCGCCVALELRALDSELNVDQVDVARGTST
jgi:hypothetical protein